MVWELVFKAIYDASKELLDDASKRITLTNEEIEILPSNDTIFEIPNDFLENPRLIPPVEQIRKDLEKYFLRIVINEGESKSLASKFPGYFIHAIHNIWRKN